MFPSFASEVTVGGFECGSELIESGEDGILRPPFESIFDFFVTVLAEENTFV